MTQCELPKEELVRRKELSDNTRKMIYSLLDVAAEDETSLMTTYRDFYLQISFSELHPLMVFYLARPLDGEKAMPGRSFQRDESAQRSGQSFRQRKLQLL